MSDEVATGEPSRWLGWRSAADTFLWVGLGVATGAIIRSLAMPAWGKSATLELMTLTMLVVYAAGSLWQRQRTRSATRNY